MRKRKPPPFLNVSLDWSDAVRPVLTVNGMRLACANAHEARAVFELISTESALRREYENALLRTLEDLWAEAKEIELAVGLL